MRILILVSSLLAVAVLPVHGQAPARDVQLLPTLSRGTAELIVVVSSDETVSQPIRRVSVAIQIGDLDLPRIGVTDDDGRVVFRDLAAGNYLIVASRPGYVLTHYGSTKPGHGPGLPVSVVEGARTPEVRIKMLRGSVLTGVIRNTAGRPAPRQQVHATLVRSSGGEKRAGSLEESAGNATTDDRGVYRIFGLAPGEYLVSLPLASLAGQDVRPVTAAELAWADKIVAGSGRVGSPAAMTEAPAVGASLRYSPVYYPGTAVAAEAHIVTLGAGEERGGVDFGFLLVPTAQVRGRVVDSENRPQSGVGVRLTPVQPDNLDLFAPLSTSADRTGPDGAFTFSGVKPGSYTLSARATPSAGTAPAAPLNPAEAMQQAMGGGPGATHWASEDFTVQGRDISDVTLTLRPGMTMSGKIVYESTTKAPPTDVSRIALGLIPATMGSEANRMAGDFLGTGVSNVQVEADATFSVRGIAPGRYRFNSPLALLPPEAAAFFNAMSGGWTLKSVLADGRDIADAPIEIRAGGNVSGVIVTFTDQPSELTGTVLDATGRPTPGFPIVVFSTDRAYWTNGSRRVQQVRPATSGRFTITGLPAGEYFVCAVTSVDRNEVYDPVFLDQLIPGSFKITIQDGEKKTQDLKLGGG